MKKLRIPVMPGGINLLEPKKPAGGKHRAAGRKLVSKTGRHRLDKPNAVPAGEPGGYRGAHRRSDPPPPGKGGVPGKGRAHRYATNERLTPADDREHGYFRRRTK